MLCYSLDRTPQFYTPSTDHTNHLQADIDKEVTAQRSKEWYSQLGPKKNWQPFTVRYERDLKEMYENKKLLAKSRALQQKRRVFPNLKRGRKGVEALHEGSGLASSGSILLELGRQDLWFGVLQRIILRRVWMMICIRLHAMTRLQVVVFPST